MNKPTRKFVPESANLMDQVREALRFHHYTKGYKGTKVPFITKPELSPFDNCLLSTGDDCCVHRPVVFIQRAYRSIFPHRSTLADQPSSIQVVEVVSVTSAGPSMH